MTLTSSGVSKGQSLIYTVKSSLLSIYSYLFEHCYKEPATFSPLTCCAKMEIKNLELQFFVCFLRIPMKTYFIFWINCINWMCTTPWHHNMSDDTYVVLLVIIWQPLYDFTWVTAVPSQRDAGFQNTATHKTKSMNSAKSDISCCHVRQMNQTAFLGKHILFVLSVRGEFHRLGRHKQRSIQFIKILQLAWRVRNDLQERKKNN